ncbi:MAG: LLM class flavin-dependent oxidoreductase [Natronomonas sp.]|uniref:LLM class flavin-dependent oxidoreductase n=1 Tax=Natronomonas sp. TaxID=2184060 RepID=UPI0028708887|nr:LLM class flavin-dependent oxidoreductase [Natronomonas sp.]MDR9430153.1 LLM class flavin-dependent oxidoreductase [Natronomonas sp.]
MDIGTTLPTGCTEDYQVAPDALRDWATAADDAGFAGLWTLDHLVTPEPYVTSVLNPLVALSHAAAVTDDIPLGTSILLLPLRGATNTADAALSLQYLAEHQVTLGLGAGYVPDEFEVTGVPRNERGPRLSEGIDVLQELFSGNGSYDGRFHQFEDIAMDPVLDDPPRVLAGGSSLYTGGEMPKPMLDRIVRSDGWIAPPLAPERAEKDWAAITAHAEERGVDPDGLDRVTLNYCYVVDTKDSEAAYERQREAFAEFFSPERGFDHARENCLTGSLSDIHEQLTAYEEFGFDQVIAGTPAHAPDDLAAQMELLTAELLGAWG